MFSFTHSIVSKYKRPDVDLSHENVEEATVTCSNDATAVTLRCTAYMQGPQKIRVAGPNVKSVFVDFVNKPLIRHLVLPVGATYLYGEIDIPLTFEMGCIETTIAGTTRREIERKAN